ncbi:hypothetical protein LB504_006222 [Fusarium proliferatum]|nr:hypothetical protein LB504_006222 [Fusarium proliferatum]
MQTRRSFRPSQVLGPDRKLRDARENIFRSCARAVGFNTRVDLVAGFEATVFWGRDNGSCEVLAGNGDLDTDELGCPEGPVEFTLAGTGSVNFDEDVLRMAGSRDGLLG